MTYRLFVDDDRAPYDEKWVVARTVVAAQEYISTYGLPLFLSLDHDLGDGCDVILLINWFIDQTLDGVFNKSEILKMNVKFHTANMIGGDNMEKKWINFRHFLQNS